MRHCSGHLEKKWNKERIPHGFYWFGVREDSDLWVQMFDISTVVMSPPQYLRAMLGNIPIGAPLDRIETDVLIPMPLTPRGNSCILLVTDHLTK